MPAFYLFNFFSRFQILVREPRIRDVIELIVLFGEGIQLCSPNESSMYKEKETLMVHWWERLSPINVALDRFRPGATCGSSLMLVRLPCFESFSQGFLVFLPSQKPTQFKFQLDQDIADPLRCIWLLHWYKYCFFFQKYRILNVIR